MTWLLSLIVFILILGIIVLVHEFGHFITAKKSNVFIYEFSIGMGPVLWSHKGKDGIYYNLRALPIGGFVQMAGEIYEDDNKIPKEKFLCNRPWYQRLVILCAGVFNNFVLALVLLFLLAIIWGVSDSTTKIIEVTDQSAAKEAGLKEGDIITAINGHKFDSWDVGQIYLYYKVKDDKYTFTVDRDGSSQDITITPKVQKDEKGKETKVFGIRMDVAQEKGFISSISYAFKKLGRILHSMAITIGGLITGNISVRNLSGPVGIYQVVNESVKYGVQQVLYIMAFISANVGFLNILPFPAFDGGHVFFMILEKILGKKMNSKIENIVTTIGFGLLMILMIVITIQDILRFF